MDTAFLAARTDVVDGAYVGVGSGLCDIAVGKMCLIAWRHKSREVVPLSDGERNQFFASEARCQKAGTAKVPGMQPYIPHRQRSRSNRFEALPDVFQPH